MSVTHARSQVSGFGSGTASLPKSISTQYPKYRHHTPTHKHIPVPHACVIASRSYSCCRPQPFPPRRRRAPGSFFDAPPPQPRRPSFRESLSLRRRDHTPWIVRCTETRYKGQHRGRDRQHWPVQASVSGRGAGCCAPRCPIVAFGLSGSPSAWNDRQADTHLPRAIAFRLVRLG